MEFNLDSSTKVKFEKESYNLVLMQESGIIFLSKEHVKKLVDLCKEQNFID